MLPVGNGIYNPNLPPSFGLTASTVPSTSQTTNPTTTTTATTTTSTTSTTIAGNSNATTNNNNNVGQKRAFDDIVVDGYQGTAGSDDLANPSSSSILDNNTILGVDGKPLPRKKGRKKGYIWAHTIVDENGKVHCKHCNALIRVKYGEKVERLRHHFIKSCHKSPFQKDTREYEELLETVNNPQQERKKSFVSHGGNKAKNNRALSYSVSFVAAVLGGPYTELNNDQIKRLETQGNYSSNWTGVKLICSGSTVDATIERIRGCCFNGTVYIGSFAKNTTIENNLTVVSGLYNSNFHGTCVFSDNCYVFNCAIICNTFVGRNSALMNCGRVVCEGITSYGANRIICIGSESASSTSNQTRSIALNIAQTYFEVCDGALNYKKIINMTTTSSNIEESNDWQQANKGNNKRGPTSRSRGDDVVRYDMSIICDDVQILQCPSLKNIFVGSYSRIMASSVNNSTLFSHCKIDTSECTDCVLHSASSICGKSFCEGALLFPHSSISNGAKVEESVLGPDSSVSTGECKRSLLGPFVGFHHQGLLISSCWPLGRGNIAYGAMIGANHTGRTNDQECLPGEGCFFGLSSSVRFPFNIMFSPYSMIAANTQCAPQRIAFPFSLISNYDASHDDRGLNSKNMLRPAWVLWSNAYFVERAVVKFSKRRKSVDYRTDFPIFRPSIVDMVIDARSRLLNLRRLQVIPASDEVSVLNLEEQHLPGVGHCLVLSTDVDRAIDAYTKFIRRYALHGLLFLIATLDSCKTDTEAPNPVYLVNDPSIQHSGVHMDLNSADLNSDSEEDDTEIALMQQGSARAVAAVAMTGVGANVPGGYPMSMSSAGASASSDPSMNQMQISMQHQHHAQQLTGPQLSPSLTPFLSLLEDIRNMELSPQATIEDFMLRSEQRRGNLMESISGHNKRAVMEFGSCGPNHILGALVARNGSCCLLGDSHIYSVRCHQLRILFEEFPGIDFTGIIDSFPRGGVMPHSPPVAAIHYEKLRVLLQMLVELERANADNVRTGRKKDLLRANDVIGTAIAADANVLADDDDVVIIARQRLDDINLCVHRIVNQLHISP
eukprot:gene1635-1784_t